MELDIFLESIPEEDSRMIKALIKDYVRPLTMLANYYISTRYPTRVRGSEFDTVVDAAKHDGVLEFVNDVITSKQRLEE